ncbi:MAG TPA: PPC domain-containing DNA-binding protein [Negativicutes bacterium]|nr:PPC domain-containing DNA-binding protein [Negativicutes bacterium]
MEAHKGRTIAARLMPGTDLVTEIEAVCRAHRLKYGYFASVIGSLQKAQYVISIPKVDASHEMKTCVPIIEEGPVELVCGQGVICQSEKGELMIHLHAHGITADQKNFAGHFSAGGNPVLATIELIIVEIDGAKLMRRYDPIAGLVMFSPEL